MRRSQTKLLYKSLQLSALFLIVTSALVYLILNTYIKSTLEARVERLQLDIEKIVAQNRAEITSKAFDIAYSTDFSKDLIKSKDFKSTKSYLNNNNSFPYLGVFNNKDGKLLNMSEIALDDDSRKDMTKLLEPDVAPVGVGIIGKDIVSYKVLKLLNSKNKLLLAKPMVNRYMLGSYAKGHWNFNFFLKDKLLLSSIQNPQLINRDKILLQEAALNDRFQIINDNWSIIEGTHHYIRKVTLANSKSMAMLYFDPKNIELPVFLEVVLALPLLFCLILVLMGIHIFNYHEKDILEPISQLHLELAKLKSDSLHELKAGGWNEIKGIVNNLNSIIGLMNKEHSTMKATIEKNLFEYKLIKEQLAIDEFQFYTILEFARDYIKAAENSLNADEAFDGAMSEFTSFKYIARNFELTSLQEVQDRLEESMKNENPINRETQIMEHYVNLIELIHKYKLIREDLGFSIEPPTKSKHHTQASINGRQVIRYIKDYKPQNGNYNIICQFEDEEEFDVASLSQLYKALVEFEQEHANINAVDVFYDKDKNLFILAIDHSVQLKTSV